MSSAPKQTNKTPQFQLDPGVYIIYNCVLSSNGEQLAITFKGQDKSITVTPLDSSSSNQQNLKYNEERATPLQYEEPQASQGLAAGWRDTIYTGQKKLQNWGITKDEPAYTIRDGDKSIMWSIQSAARDALVIPLKEAIGEKQCWIFCKVDTPLPC
ncbi:unnamed protein product [Rhizoctonia solani]|uniref:CCL2-like lectin domain-containing protein n=1 Tax=Rhizoctonia solani TaxID=456999 RepID=A0A8H3A883_9AGAM|nr:unnamed protein product [Rhizoctonia solani]